MGLFVGARRPVGECLDEEIAAAEDPFHEAPSPPSVSSQSPRLRALLM